MSITPISSTEFDTNQIIEFNIEFGKNGKDKKVKEIYDKLIFVEDLSYGKIYIQKATENYWYINPNETYARLITQERLSLFREWDKKELLISDDKLKILTNIGGLPTTRYSLVPTNIQVPAKIKTTDGHEIDFCVFVFSSSPPFQRYFKKIILMDEVAEIEPSEFAISHDLRLLSTLAEDIRMGFFPFMVSTVSGKLMTYNGITQFASDGAIKSKDIIDEVSFTYDKFDGVISDVNYDKITFVIGKWDERLEKLFLQYKNMLEMKISSKNRQPQIKIKKKWWQRFYNYAFI